MRIQDLVTFIDALENVKYNVAAVKNLRDMHAVMAKSTPHEHANLAILRDAVLEDKDYQRAYNLLRQILTYSVR